MSASFKGWVRVTNIDDEVGFVFVNPAAVTHIAFSFHRHQKAQKCTANVCFIGGGNVMTEVDSLDEREDLLQRFGCIEAEEER